MKRTLYYYYLSGEKKPAKKYKMPENLKNDIKDSAELILEKPKNDRKKDVKSKKKIIYLADIKNLEDENTIILEFISAKYARIRTVIDTNTLKEQELKKKGRDDGDEESVSIGIKFLENNEAICVYEYNRDAAGFQLLIQYLQEEILKIHKDKNDGIGYKLKTEQKVSKDFLAALKKTEKITAVKITVDSEDATASEIKEISGRSDLSEDVEIIYKPSGKNILTNTVKKFFEIYNDSQRKIKKVYVESKGENGNPLHFDTEEMREKEILDVEETYSGEVDKGDLYDQMIRCLSNF
ncbi:hypothetical protein [Anaerostipes hadrus]|jgi:hypothetical protein|uniref:Uncharacterized protein n=1 Tax=Anaerostipes hadrus TaxID=649756 RepID=A0A1Q2C3X6_ANAHA|nr:hypothetical protein [Anaerostipes hadrus]AQP38424.1 hypothetical protein DO83_01495 [Anaerostipes hadrus]